jgi:hypothetical protein
MADVEQNLPSVELKGFKVLAQLLGHDEEDDISCLQIFPCK